MGQRFDQRKSLEEWLATENIANLQLKLSKEEGTCERKLLEALIVLDSVKFCDDPMKAVIAAA